MARRFSLIAGMTLALVLGACVPTLPELQIGTAATGVASEVAAAIPAVDAKLTLANTKFAAFAAKVQHYGSIACNFPLAKESVETLGAVMGAGATVAAVVEAGCGALTASGTVVASAGPLEVYAADDGKPIVRSKPKPGTVVTGTAIVRDANGREVAVPVKGTVSK